MITGLPAHRPPVAQAVRCLCRRRYFVYVDVLDSEARTSEQIAGDLSARFIDARCEPFVTCECGQVLDFAPEASMLSSDL